MYKLEQEQRYNERHIRKYKRLRDGSLDEGNRREYTSRLAGWEKRQKDFIEQHGDVLRRRRENEVTRGIQVAEPPKLRQPLAKPNGSGIISTREISGAINPYKSKARAKAHAKRFYEEVRHRTTDVERIAKATGFSIEEIDGIKHFLFIDVHDLGEGEVRRFDPNFMIAESWQRLADGKPLPHDITLIRHELLEMELMETGMTQDEAHRMASKKYNYSEEADKYYGEIN